MNLSELILKLETDTNFTLLLAKKMVILNETVASLALTLPGGGERSLLLEAFVLRPDLQKTFYEQVTKVAEEEAELARTLATPNALRLLAEIISDTSDRSDTKDKINASRAILSYSNSKVNKPGAPIDPLDDLYNFVTKGPNGS